MAAQGPDTISFCPDRPLHEVLDTSHLLRPDRQWSLNASTRKKRRRVILARVTFHPRIGQSDRPSRLARWRIRHFRPKLGRHVRQQLRRLVLANGPASIELWSQSTQKLRAELANDIQEIIDEADRPDQTESPEYQEAVGVFYKKHLCRTEPWPAPEVQSAFRWMTEDPTVYGTM
jgi:hypothetical protein